MEMNYHLLMKNGKITCFHCKAQFYFKNQSLCGTCNKPFCPNCQSCQCTKFSYSLNQKKRQVVTLKEINQLPEGQPLEITALISPLKGQTPIKTQNGPLLKTEFELSDDHIKFPLIVWGPVPEKLFPYRYEFTNLTISGLKKKIFNGTTVLVASKSTKYYLNTLKTKSLDYFISESVVS